jgi:hypothetical protein
MENTQINNYTLIKKGLINYSFKESWCAQIKEYLFTQIRFGGFGKLKGGSRK